MGIFSVRLLVLFGIIISLQSANALTCYQCSLSNKCNDPFDKQAGVSTTTCYTTCSKTKSEYSGIQGTPLSSLSLTPKPYPLNANFTDTSSETTHPGSKQLQDSIDIVTRDCGSGSDTKCDEISVGGAKVQTCQCSTDLCNGVLPVRGSFIALAASVVVFLIFL